MSEVFEDEKEPEIVVLEEPDEKEEVPPTLLEVSKEIDSAVNRSNIERCKTKAEYIVQIKKLTGDFSDRVLVRMKKDELKELLAKKFESTLEEVVSPLPVEKDKNANMVVQTMYRVLLATAAGIEGLTKSYHPYLGGMVLHKYAENIDNNVIWREITMDVLREVYEENQAMLCNLMTKEGRLICVLFMAGAASVRPFSSVTNGESRFDRPRAQQDSMHSRPPRFRKVKPEPPHSFCRLRRGTKAGQAKAM